MKRILKIVSPFAITCCLYAPMSMTSCSDKTMYSKPKHIAPYLHEITYDDYRYDSEYETIDESEAFGCSSVRYGNFYGRNFDYVYNDTPEFIVHVKANEKKQRHESIGVATHFGLRENKMLEGKYHKQLELIPNFTLDGINDAGVICSTNVVSMEPNAEEGIENLIPETRPDDGAKDLHVLFIPRFVLDNATDAWDGVRRLTERNIIGNLSDKHNIHCMIADKEHTYVVEFFHNKNSAHNHFDVICEEKNGINAIMTNHYLNMDQAGNWTNDEKFGNERLEILKDGYPKTEEEKANFNFDSMVELMQRVKFSKAYWNDDHYGNHNPVPLGRIATDGKPGNLDSEWYSEGMTQKQIIEEPDKTEAEWHEFSEEVLGRLKEEYWIAIENEDRSTADPNFWQTTHNSTYEWDWDNHIARLQIIVQEKYDMHYNYELKLKNTQ